MANVNLTLQNARTTVENAVLFQVLLAVGRRLWTPADIPTLRTIQTYATSGSGETVRDINDLAFVTSAGLTYRWSTTATGADDGVTTIIPNDLPPGNPGRWLQTTSTVSGGYLRRCALYNDDPDDEEAVIRAMAQLPAVLITYSGGKHKPKSKQPGSLYWWEGSFVAWVIATDMRGGQTARQGSLVGTEAATNPGTSAMLGDLKATLAGLSGEDLSLPDVAYIEIGDEYPVAKSVANRRFVEALEFKVYATLTPGDPLAQPLSDPYEFNVQEQLAGEPNQANAPAPPTLGPTPGPLPSGGNIIFDPNNYVSAGMQCPLGASLTQTIAAGAAIVGGVGVNPVATPNTFPASSATYRDLLPNGSYVFQSTKVGQNPPPVTLNALRVGVTITDASSVVADEFLCDSLVNFGPQNKVSPPTLQSIALTPNPASVPHGSNFQFTATGTYSDGSTQDLTFGGLTWQSSNPAVATITNYGQAQNTNAGTTNITASLGGVTSPPDTLTVT